MAESCIALHLTQFQRVTILHANISQGSVVTCLRKGGIINFEFTGYSPWSLYMKEFWKSINIWQC